MSNRAFIAVMFRGAVFAVGLMTCHALHANDAPVRPPTTGVLAEAARSHTYVGALTAGWRSLLDAHVPKVDLYLGMNDDDAPEPLRYADYKAPKAPMSPALLVWSRDVKASSSHTALPWRSRNGFASPFQSPDSVQSEWCNRMARL